MKNKNIVQIKYYTRCCLMSIPKEFLEPLSENEIRKLKWLETHGYENCEDACIMRTRYKYGNLKKSVKTIKK